MTDISVTVVEDDPAIADEQIRQLREELLGLEVDSVEFGPGQVPPEGAKGVDGATLSLVVTLSSSPVLIIVGRTLRDWVNRAKDRSLIIRKDGRSLEITGARTGQDRKLIEAFLRDGQL
ncbi:hypothetical protein QRX60_43260 [Amycolatopsis mongoliensis]|uniref:Uncharacterized protein n=1 Tax=Amycolatopsis mongoliensis TaxID=715475 RepID=A0A9Y2JLH5_9PSEU|nr:hypothetical protein [Amycolatopsis sp. 4-36]WIY00806.1 hypothetical protein QRX60_43260 [Amycolatopsis sp. 4-36]